MGYSLAEGLLSILSFNKATYKLITLPSITLIEQLSPNIKYGPNMHVHRNTIWDKTLHCPKLVINILKNISLSSNTTHISPSKFASLWLIIMSTTYFIKVIMILITLQQYWTPSTFVWDAKSNQSALSAQMFAAPASLRIRDHNRAILMPTQLVHRSIPHSLTTVQTQL